MGHKDSQLWSLYVPNSGLRRLAAGFCGLRAGFVGLRRVKPVFTVCFGLGLRRGLRRLPPGFGNNLIQNWTPSFRWGEAGSGVEMAWSTLGRREAAGNASTAMQDIDRKTSRGLQIHGRQAGRQSYRYGTTRDAPPTGTIGVKD